MTTSGSLKLIILAFASAAAINARAEAGTLQESSKISSIKGDAPAGHRHRVIVSTDAGGTDPDDLQSLVHLFVYADCFDIEGLISSPYGPGRKKHILEVIDCYAEDYVNLKTYSGKYPTPGMLRSLTKQGETEVAPYAGVRRTTEGSDWIVKCARRNDPRPLHLLVWGGIEDLAQALHDAPDILPKLRVYWIGGPNKKWDPNAFHYIAAHHPKLWIIESNATYRGWFTGGDRSGQWGDREFVKQHIAGKGALGDFFVNKKSDLKMGDTPSVGRLLKGTPGDPTQPGWGGRFVRAWKRPYLCFERMTRNDDRMEVFGILELALPMGKDFPERPEAALQVENQKLSGHAPGDGTMRFRFCPKAAKTYRFMIQSNVPALNGKTGGIKACIPSPAMAKRPAANLPNWWTDDPSPELAEGPHSGAKTVNRWRKDFLRDFAVRMLRCQSPAKHDSERKDARPRVIATSDGEIDDECSLVRFLLCANEWDVEAIITSSSQYHWRGHRWAGDDWAQPYLQAYAKVYPNLVKHDPRYPPPDYLQARTLLGNVKAEGEMDEATAGSQYIVKVLLDKSDNRPVWLQAWGGPNTIARALKTIEEKHPDQMAYVADKIRLFCIWEQDSTYQEYIRPHWGKYNILTIVSDQFEALAYRWDRIIPEEKRAFFSGAWMKNNILQGHGPLCALYKAHKDGRFRSEGDSPAFLHTIVTGLRNMESPDRGGWGGRYVRVRENTWLDPVLEAGYRYPRGRWYSSTAWGRQRARKKITNDHALFAYLKPMWRWIDALQNDFAARADWCVRDYENANHPPQAQVAGTLDRTAHPNERVQLNAGPSKDPDGDRLTFKWWRYAEADTCKAIIDLSVSEDGSAASFTVPDEPGKNIHIILEVTDSGNPPLTRYRRVIMDVKR